MTEKQKEKRGNGENGNSISSDALAMMIKTYSRQIRCITDISVPKTFS